MLGARGAHSNPTLDMGSTPFNTASAPAASTRPPPPYWRGTGFALTVDVASTPTPRGRHPQPRRDGQSYYQRGLFHFTPNMTFVPEIRHNLRPLPLSVASSSWPPLSLLTGPPSPHHRRDLSRPSLVKASTPARWTRLPSLLPALPREPGRGRGTGTLVPHGASALARPLFPAAPRGPPGRLRAPRARRGLREAC